MSGKTIATIYFYVISAASLALIVIGIFNSVNFFINTTQYNQYPLRYSQASCENTTYGYPARPYTLEQDQASISASDLEKQKQACIKQQEEDRKQHRIDDLKNATSFSLVGLVLFFIHFPLARKQSTS
jgi:ABC-type Na+ efflux pump permease subunit